MKIPVNKLISAVSLAIASAQTEFATIHYKLQSAASELAPLVLAEAQDSDFINNLFKHGCWCAKVTNLDPVGLGGNRPVDELDQICKDWARARRCTRESGASCDSQDVDSGVYQVEYLSDGTRQYLCPDVDSCLSETCQVDVFYLNEIFDWRSSNVGFYAVENPECPVPVGGQGGNGGSCDAFVTTQRPETTVAPVDVMGWADVQQRLAAIDPVSISFEVDTTEFHGPVPESGNLAELAGGIVDEDIQDLPGSESLGNFLQDQPLRKKRSLLRGTFSVNQDFIPAESLDLRDHAQCGGLVSWIGDQGSCGSCWAFAATGVSQDSTCIASEGRSKAYHSQLSMMSCCSNCDYGHMCISGNPYRALYHYYKNGISTSTCRPYDLSNDRTCNGNCADSIFGGTDSGEARLLYTQGYRGGYSDPSNVVVHQVQEFITTHGSMVAIIDTYPEFYAYRSGVYIADSNQASAGNHVIRIIGWGTQVGGSQDGVEYWLCANSWGTQWGENGFFKMRRGTNEGRVETNPIGGFVYQCAEGEQVNAEGRCGAESTDDDVPDFFGGSDDPSGGFMPEVIPEVPDFVPEVTPIPCVSGSCLSMTACTIHLPVPGVLFLKQHSQANEEPEFWDILNCEVIPSEGSSHEGQCIMELTENIGTEVEGKKVELVIAPLGINCTRVALGEGPTYVTTQPPTDTTVAVLDSEFTQVYGETCGRYPGFTPIMNRIVNGHSASISEHHYQAKILVLHWHSGLNYIFECGATIISSKHVLTAAQCVSWVSEDGSSEFDVARSKIFIGRESMQNSENMISWTDDATIYTFESVTVHPGFNQESMNDESEPILHDITVIASSRTFQFSENVYPACLPSRDFCLEKGTLARASGWGTTDPDMSVPKRSSHDFSYVDLPIAECAMVRRSDKANFVCAGDGYPSTASVCIGDLGGPLAHKSDDGIYTVFGVTSHVYSDDFNGRSCLSAPQAFTRVSMYLDWIHESSQVAMEESNGDLSPTATCDDTVQNLSWENTPVAVPTTPEPFTDSDCHWIHGSWGEPLVCPDGYVLAGICGSGGNADCGGYYHKINCCQADPRVTEVNSEMPTETCGWVTHTAGNFKMLSECPANYVAAGRCGSGRTADCEMESLPGHVFGSDEGFEDFSGVGSWSGENGNKNHHAVYCCHVETDPSSEVWEKGAFGESIWCPPGHVITGACGSDDFNNCQDVGPALAGWYATAIKCERWSAMPLV